MADIYTPISESQIYIEFSGLQYIWTSGTAIIETPKQSDEFYNPSTDNMDTLFGRTKYDNITVTGLFSATQFGRLEALKLDKRSKDGTMTATHKMAELTTILTGVKWGRLEWGEFNRGSANASMVKLEFSFSGIGNTQQNLRAA